MSRKTAHDFDQGLLVLFDACVHGAIDRRTFLGKAARFAVGGVTAMMLLDQLRPDFAAAQVISGEDQRIAAKHLELDSPKGNGKARGYLVHPAAPKGKLPGVLVIVACLSDSSGAIAWTATHGAALPARWRRAASGEPMSIQASSLPVRSRTEIDGPGSGAGTRGRVRSQGFPRGRGPVRRTPVVPSRRDRGGSRNGPC